MLHVHVQPQQPGRVRQDDLVTIVLDRRRASEVAALLHIYDSYGGRLKEVNQELMELLDHRLAGVPASGRVLELISKAKQDMQALGDDLNPKLFPAPETT